MMDKVTSALDRLMSARQEAIENNAKLCEVSTHDLSLAIVVLSAEMRAQNSWYKNNPEAERIAAQTDKEIALTNLIRLS
jgi:hypothetical protein